MPQENRRGSTDCPGPPPAKKVESKRNSGDQRALLGGARRAGGRSTVFALPPASPMCVCACVLACPGSLNCLLRDRSACCCQREKLAMYETIREELDASIAAASPHKNERVATTEWQDGSSTYGTYSDEHTRDEWQLEAGIQQDAAAVGGSSTGEAGWDEELQGQEHLLDDWMKYKSRSSGEVYFFNTASGESTFEPPPAAAEALRLKDEARQLYDKTAGPAEARAEAFGRLPAKVDLAEAAVRPALEPVDASKKIAEPQGLLHAKQMDGQPSWQSVFATAPTTQCNLELGGVVTAFAAEEVGDLMLEVGETVVLTQAEPTKRWWRGYREADPSCTKGNFLQSCIGQRHTNTVSTTLDPERFDVESLDLPHSELIPPSMTMGAWIPRTRVARGSEDPAPQMKPTGAAGGVPLRPGARMATVITAFEGQQPGDLSLALGQLVMLTKAKAGKNWWRGRLAPPAEPFKGTFPRVCVEELQHNPQTGEPSTRKSPFINVRSAVWSILRHVDRDCRACRRI